MSKNYKNCEYKCNIKQNLNNQIQTHSRDKLFKCPENNCEYKCIKK